MQKLYRIPKNEGTTNFPIDILGNRVIIKPTTAVCYTPMDDKSLLGRPQILGKDDFV